MGSFIEIEATGRDKITSFRLAHDFLHGHVSGEENELATSFPDYMNNDVHCQMGNRLRVIGCKNKLNEIVNHAVLARLTSQSMLTVSAIQPVPDNHIHVRFIRDRSLDKAKKKERETGEKAQFVRMPSIERQSKENKYPHRVFVRKELAIEPVKGSFSSFGLSKDGSTVPYWK